MKRSYKWIIVIVVLIGLTSYFSYRLTLSTMEGSTPASSPAGPKQENSVEAREEFKKLIGFNPAPTPAHLQIKKVQHDIFYSTPQIRAIRSSISVLHQELDYKLRPEVFAAMSRDKKDKGWEGFTGALGQTGNGVREMVTRIDNMIVKLENQTLITDMAKAQQLLTKGTEERNVLKLWEAHKIIHDLDYYLLNYPVTVKTGLGAVKESINGPEQYWKATSILP